MKIHHTIIRWLENYLLDRSQTTFVDMLNSNSIQVSSGVTQGSVLGPLLFIIYLDLISAIMTQWQHTTVYAYADNINC